MAMYPFECQTCVDEDDNRFQFTLRMAIKDYNPQQSCPTCGGECRRILTVPAIHEGLTAAEKTAGTTRNRKDSGKYMKDAREKRKRAYGKGTREGDSNELWTGNEKRDGAFKGPSDFKLAGT